MVGTIINDMKILGISKLSGTKQTRYDVECIKCKRTKTMLRQNITKRVGTTHKACSQGFAKEYPQLYRAWTHMVSRCTNPNDSRYPDYGGRGISHEFELFIDFVDYMLEAYLEQITKFGQRDTVLDRIDNDKGYIKGNMRWVTNLKSAENRKTTKSFIAISPDGIETIEFNIASFAREHGMDKSNISKCLKGTRKHYSNWVFREIESE